VLIYLYINTYTCCVVCFLSSYVIIYTGFRLIGGGVYFNHLNHQPIEFCEEREKEREKFHSIHPYIHTPIHLYIHMRYIRTSIHLYYPYNLYIYTIHTSIHHTRIHHKQFNFEERERDEFIVTFDAAVKAQEHVKV